MKIFNFKQFVNEAYVPPSGTTGVPLYRQPSFKPERYIKRNAILPELQDMLGQVASGSLKSLTVVAEISTHGKKAPQYIKDLYSEMGYVDSLEDDDMYDPETDTYKGKRGKNEDEPEVNVFVDSEFIVKDIDMKNGVVMGIPYSLRRKGIMVEIDPEKIDEIFIE